MKWLFGGLGAVLGIAMGASFVAFGIANHPQGIDISYKGKPYWCLPMDD